MNIILTVEELIRIVLALGCSALLSFILTPAVSVLAHKIGAIDVPKDDRRMHNHPIPLIGGLAVYGGIVFSTLAFGYFDHTTVAVLFGGLLIVAVGVLDDVFDVKPYVKLIVQLAAALVAVWQGVRIPWINFFGHYIELGMWSIPITVIWIIGLSNAINLIDGLDGLSCGISAICSFSLLLITIVSGSPITAVFLCAVITGACFGFLPFNSSPAKIFIGDTGALFLGYALAVISVDGVFKLHAVLIFIIPVIVFGLPLFDTFFAIFRRLKNGQAPWHADHGHIHHRLIAMGFDHKQAVRILYAVCATLGLSAVLLTVENGEGWRAVIVIGAAVAIFIIDFLIIRNPDLRRKGGFEEKKIVSAEEKTENKNNGENETETK